MVEDVLAVCAKPTLKSGSNSNGLASSHEAYLQSIQAIPLLSAEEEFNLAKRFHETEDLEAAHALVLAHLRYVARIARQYAGYGLAIPDLVQEGAIGLMKAVKRFDPSMGVRLASFAVHWIKAEINEFVIRNWRIVRVATTKAQRKLFFKLRGAKQRLGWFSKEEVRALAQDLGVKPEEVLEMELRLNSQQDLSFELSGDVSSEEENRTFVPAAYLSSPEADPALLLEARAESRRIEHMREAIQNLDSRSQTILEERWLSQTAKTTFKDLAERFQISIERVRQLEQAALKKLKAALGPSCV